MNDIRRMTERDIEECASLYRSAYQAEPWKEEYTEDEIRKYLSEFMRSESMSCFVLIEKEQIVGLALTILIPGMDAPYLRIEDFCIDTKHHRKGLGSRFIDLIAVEAKKRGCDSILLGTQRGFPAHQFYQRNGFREIESVLMYREAEQ